MVTVLLGEKVNLYSAPTGRCYQQCSEVSQKVRPYHSEQKDICTSSTYIDAKTSRGITFDIELILKANKVTLKVDPCVIPAH